MTGSPSQSQRTTRDDRGSVLFVTALLLPVLLLMTAFAIDLGMQRSSRRTMQARADIIALDLVRLADGRDTQTIKADPVTEQALVASAARNNIERAKIVDVKWGTWGKESGFIEASNSGIPTAVRVTATETTKYLFAGAVPGAPKSGGATRSAIATASDEPAAYFQVGSFLLSVNPATNSLLGQLLQSVIPGASVLSYNGLAGANVTLGQLQVGLQAVAPGAVLDTTISYRDLLVASVSALQANGGSTAAIGVLNNLIALAPTVPALTLGDLVQADLTGGTPAATASFNVIGLLTGAVLLSDTEHAISIPGTTLGIPGLGGLNLSLSVIERPQIGGPNLFDTATTGQIRLTITPQIAVNSTGATINICTLSNAIKEVLSNLLGGVLNLLQCLLGGINGVVGLQVNVSSPITIDVAKSVVTLSRIDCGSAKGIQLTPSPTPVSVTTNLNATVSATLLGNSLGNVAAINVPAKVTSTGASAPEYFTYPAQFGPPPRSTASAPLGLAGLLQIDAADVTLLNVPLGPIVNPVLTPLLSTLNSTLGLLDASVVGPITDLLGLSLGGADLTALSLECGRPGPRLVG